MHRSIPALLGAAALAVPATDAWAAAAKEATKTKVVTKTVAGPAVETERWGPVRVTLVVRKTTTATGSKTKVTRKIVGVTAVYPGDSPRSAFINEQAIPILKSETLKAQSASIDMVSGATGTSEAFVQSLQAAITKAKSV